MPDIEFTQYMRPNGRRTRRPALPPRAGVPVSAWPPTAGHYLMPLLRGAVPVTVRIWFGAPLDPLTGAELDRAHRWNVEIDGMISTLDGELLDIDRAWPWCAKRPISEAEYRYRRALAIHAAEHEPTMAEAAPHKRISWLTVPVS
jgi:hypothetical protein